MALEARERLPGDELNSLERRQSANCDMAVMTCKAADAQCDITNSMTSLHRDIVSSSYSLRRGFGGALVEVGRRLKKIFNCEARSLQRSVCDAVRVAAKET